MSHRTVSGRMLFAVALLGAAPIASAQPVSNDSSIARPTYRFLRYTEDWSAVDDWSTVPPADPWDGVKHVPISDDGDAWASFGGSARLRTETWSNFGFGAPGDDDDTFLLWRLLLHADVHVGEHLRGFVEGKSAGSTERNLPGGRRGLDVDSLDLQQGFIDLTISLRDGNDLTLRGGRQALLFGKQRLVSPLAWSNTLRSWDGVSALWTVESWTVHGFWTQFAPIQKYRFNDPDAQQAFFGVYASGPVAEGDVNLDLYFLGLDRDDPVTFNGTTGDEERYTVGGRISGAVPGSSWDYDLEAAYQFGEVGSGDVDAFMFGGQIGYRPAFDRGSPRVWVGFDYGSGDDSAGGDVETFNQLFPLGHAHLGYVDAVGRQNILDANIGLSVKPREDMTLALAGHWFWRDEAADALYNAGGGVLRAGAPGTDREVGQEIDLTLKYTLNRHLAAECGYSHFFPGDFLDETGPGDDIDFVYVQLQYTF